MRRVIVLLISVGVSIGFLAVPVGAESQLRQVIEPIECTATVTSTGQQSFIHNTCDEALVPIITGLTVTEKALIIRGKFNAAQLRHFKIYVFGASFTYGSSPYLTASGDDWQLDLSPYRQSILPGSYDIGLEYQSNNDHLYRRIVENHIVVPAMRERPEPISNPQPDGNMVLPAAGERNLPSYMYGGQPIELLYGATQSMIVENPNPHGADLEIDGDLHLRKDYHEADKSYTPWILTIIVATSLAIFVLWRLKRRQK